MQKHKAEGKKTNKQKKHVIYATRKKEKSNNSNKTSDMSWNNCQTKTSELRLHLLTPGCPCECHHDRQDCFLFPEELKNLWIPACIWLKTITPLEGQVIEKKDKNWSFCRERCWKSIALSSVIRRRLGILYKMMSRRTPENNEKKKTPEAWTARGNSHVDATEAWEVQRVEVQPEALVHLPTYTTDLTRAYNHFEH